MMCGEADQHGIAAILLAHELADIQLTPLAHVGHACIAEVGIMLPHGNFCGPVSPAEMRDQRVQRFGHVPVAQVP